jgi:hypothetical protein
VWSTPLFGTNSKACIHYFIILERAAHFSRAHLLGLVEHHYGGTFHFLLMRSVTTLAHFSRAPSSCAHGLGNQLMVLENNTWLWHMYRWSITTLAQLLRHTSYGGYYICGWVEVAPLHSSRA